MTFIVRRGTVEQGVYVLYLTFTLEILVMLGFPVGLGLLLKRRTGVTWGLIMAGAFAFVASQVVHLPLNWALGLVSLPSGGGRGVALWPLPLMALVAGLSAGVCEEVARYLVLRFWQRDSRSWTQGVAFGVGHGGVEAIFTGVLVLITFSNMLILRGMGPEALGLSGEVLEQVQTQSDAYWSIPWYLPLLGGLERISAITIQIALSLLVVRALTHHHVGWLLAAIGAHALVDGVVVFLVGVGWAPVALEGVVLLFALGGLALILASRPRPESVSRETPSA
ncbi:MAG: YhfC family glutamic-type intramembrane protease [Chloroflexota bacterium]|nr:YhfC family glutamic-type intramembrane protease [Chloroflexota bacterium]